MVKDPLPSTAKPTLSNYDGLFKKNGMLGQTNDLLKKLKVFGLMLM
jgi:hypothetical protein